MSGGCRLDAGFFLGFFERLSLGPWQLVRSGGHLFGAKKRSALCAQNHHPALPLLWLESWPGAVASGFGRSCFWGSLAHGACPACQQGASALKPRRCFRLAVHGDIFRL